MDNINAELSFEKKIDEYLRRKNAKKHGLFNDEIDMGIDYYEDFDIEDPEGGDDLNFYDYSDFIANNDPGVYQGNHRIFYIHILGGIYPDCLKTARVRPIFKGGNKNDTSSYRPISILAT